MLNIKRALIVSRLEVMRFMRDRHTMVAAGIFIGLLALGAYEYWNALPPRPQGDRLFGYAYITSMLIAFHTGIARDRAPRFDAFLTANFVSPADLYAGHLFTALIAIITAGLTAFAVALVTSLGSFSYAVWYALYWSALAFLFLPAIILTELVLNTRHPTGIVVLLFATGMTLANHFGDVKAVVETLALNATRGDYDVLADLLVRSAIAIALSVVLAVPYMWRLRRRTALHT